MNPDHLLSRLERVRQIGPGRWIARCPAHDDGRPSLSVKDGGDKLLVYCFAGCPVDDVVGAVGLNLGDLFIESRPQPKTRDDFFDRAMLAIYESDRENGRRFTAEELDKERAIWLRLRGA